MSVDLIGKHTRRPWALLVAVLLAAALGSIAIPVQVILARQTQAASQEQVAHNEQVIRDAARITHNREAALCVQVNRVLQAHRLSPDACPSVER